MKNNIYIVFDDDKSLSVTGVDHYGIKEGSYFIEKDDERHGESFAYFPMKNVKFFGDSKIWFNL